MSDEHGPTAHGCGNSCPALIGMLLLLFGVGLALKPTHWDAPQDAPQDAATPEAAPEPASTPPPHDAPPDPSAEPPAPSDPFASAGQTSATQHAQPTAASSHAKPLAPHKEPPGHGQPFGAKVHLKNGRTIAGQVIRANSREVVLKYAHGRMTLHRSDVLAIEELSESERLRAQAQHEHRQGRPAVAQRLNEHARPGGPAASYSGGHHGPSGVGPGGVVRELPTNFGPERVEPGWPPGDVHWETDPVRALARAQKERKPVLAYVGSVGCPHCVVMAKGVWRDPEVVEFSRRSAVFLAVHRRGQGKLSNSEGTVRLGVRSYPELFALDPWGHQVALRSGNTRMARLFVGRSKELIFKALRTAAEKLPQRPDALPSLPGSLNAVADAGTRNPNPYLRSKAWEPKLEALSTAALVDLFVWESDAVTRIRALNLLAGRKDDPKLSRVWRETLADDNDYVRWAGLEAIVQRKEQGLSGDVIALLEEIAHSSAARRRLQNHNNVMSDLIRVLERMPDPKGEEVLVWLVRRLEMNNGNCANAAAALGALWKVKPSPKIKRVLEEALDKTFDHEWVYSNFMRKVLTALSTIHDHDYLRYSIPEGVRRARANRGR